MAGAERQGTHDILIIEDDADTRSVLTRVLERAGYTVRVAETLAAGLVAVGRQRPDLVILDLLMPGGSGFDFVSAFRDDGRGDSIPIIVHTGHDLGAMVAEAAGMVVLLKPTSIKTLLETVKTAIEGSGQADTPSP